MVYKTATQKILIYLFIATLAITLVSGADYWMMWSILPISFFILWLVGKLFDKLEFFLKHGRSLTILCY